MFSLKKLAFQLDTYWYPVSVKASVSEREKINLDQDK